MLELCGYAGQLSRKAHKESACGDSVVIRSCKNNSRLFLLACPPAGDNASSIMETAILHVAAQVPASCSARRSRRGIEMLAMLLILMKRLCVCVCLYFAGLHRGRFALFLAQPAPGS